MNINQIAKLAGVSKATVSRVLNGKKDVSDKTRNRILDLISEFDYAPNTTARSLSNKSSPYIGVIIPDIQNTFFSEVIRGINTVLEIENYHTILFDTNENSENEHRALRDLYEQILDGLIITPVSEVDEISSALLTRLEKNGTKIIMIDRDIKGFKSDRVFIDNFKGAYDATVALIENNHTKIAAITGPKTSRPGRDRLKGFLNALSNHGIVIEDKYLINGNFKIEGGYQATKELLVSPDPPTAIFSFNNMMTLGCMKYFSEQNYTIGKDIALIGFDDIEFLTWLNIDLSVISRPTTLMGTKAANLLIEKIKSTRKSVNQLVLPVELILRGSELKSK